MQYVELAPVPELAPLLECVWTLEGHVETLRGEPQTVLPDGRPELVIHFGDPFDRIDVRDGRTTVTRQAAVLFAGQLTRQLVLQPTGRIGVLGLRFRPFGAAAVLDMAQDELAGTTPPLEALLPALATDLDALRGRMDSPTQAVPLAQRALLPFVDETRLDSGLRAVCAAIEESAGLVSIDRLASDVGMTRRHLERKFLQRVGMTPKRLARIARFQRAVRYLNGTDDDPRPGGAVTAAACGYADQAHFIRDFRDLAGCPPTEHLLTKGLLTGFFAR